MGSIVDLAFKLFGKDSVSKGLTIPSKSISFYDTFNRGKNDLVRIFKVNSQHLNYYYDVNIITRNKEVISFYCECPQFSKYHTCKHVAACLINNSDLFLDKNSCLDISNEILSSFIRNNHFGGIKERVFINLELDFSNRSFKIIIGLKKKYTINRESRFDSFMDAFLNNEEYVFGVGFTYDPKIHYISDHDRDLLIYLHGYSHRWNSNSNPFELNERELSSLLERLQSCDFLIVGHSIVHGVCYGFPTRFCLKSGSSNYELFIDDFENYSFIDNSFKYCVYDSILYVIPNTYSDLIISMVSNHLDSLIIDSEHVDVFKNGLLQDIKNDIKIDDDINDIVVCGNPSVSLYFDLNRDIVNCNIKFDYNGCLVDFFDKSSLVVRDFNFEGNILNVLLSYGFVRNNDKLILNEFDLIGDFLSNGIVDLGSKYSVFTSKKMNDIRIIKRSVVQSNFSIGSDGIMSYSFSTDNIDMSELDKIFSSLRSKKKYYKLKNGNYIDLMGNNELNELMGIFDDLELSAQDSNGNIIIPKYRALYIDSLKNSKYRSIHTDNSFDCFINNFKKYKDVSISFGSDSSILRDYQKDGVRWLYTLYKCDLGGILADEMGLGKSLQSICFIKQVLLEKPSAKIMIVCPTSLVYNWKKEFDKFANDLKYVVVSDSKSRRRQIINDFDDYSIFITSYGLVRNDNDEYENKFFDVCIIDEAQNIKNYQSLMSREVKKIKAHTKIALTGTPIENSVLELWSIFDFIMPGYLASIHKFKDSYGISDVDSESLSRLDNLNYLIQPFILRRKKSDVVTDLPDKIENNIYLDLPSKQKKLYLSILKESEREFQNIVSNEGFMNSKLKILQLLMKLRQVCVDPHILFDNYTGESIKMEKLLETVMGYVADGHKILIFSSFKTVIDRVKVMFDDNNISSYTISGSVESKRRMELVDKFNSDSTNCFLITLKSGGTGLNLVGADVVIHLDIWWNPQVENQATDRAHRIGQSKNVSVIKFITRGTIEEKILELQNKKRLLSDKLVEGKSSIMLNSLDEREIRSLLSYSDID
jgi:SNF2 family DNA or RNA helicase